MLIKCRFEVEAGDNGCSLCAHVSKDIEDFPCSHCTFGGGFDGVVGGGKDSEMNS